MRTIAVINQKGGVAKTTTAVNLAAGLSRMDKKVLLVDLDPQGNIDTSLRVNAEYDVFDALTGKIEIQQCIVNVAKNLDILTSKDTLLNAEYYLANEGKLQLKSMLERLNGFDFVIVDCPPSIGMLSQNVLAYCKEAVIPVSTDYLGLDALRKMTNFIEDIKDNYGNDIKISKIVPTLFDKRSNICKNILATIQNEYPELTSYPIRNNSKLKEAPMKGKSIFSYAKSSNGAKDYGKLVEDIASMEQLVVV
tara:strand:+ start:1382 stop:2131 length:750 start_codon:yes stop_codon:yes gene_type:complete